MSRDTSESFVDVTYNLYNSGVSRPSDNEEGEGGGGSSRPGDKEGGGCLQNFFRLFGPQFGLKKGGRSPPLDPPLYNVVTCINIG